LPGLGYRDQQTGGSCPLGMKLHRRPSGPTSEHAVLLRSSLAQPRGALSLAVARLDSPCLEDTTQAAADSSLNRKENSKLDRRRSAVMESCLIRSTYLSADAGSPDRKVHGFGERPCRPYALTRPEPTLGIVCIVKSQITIREQISPITVLRMASKTPDNEGESPFP
jgi:hypothetical protein